MPMTSLHNFFLCIDAPFFGGGVMILCSKLHIILLEECFFTHYQGTFLFVLRSPQVKILSGIVVVHI